MTSLRELVLESNQGEGWNDSFDIGLLEQSHPNAKNLKIKTSVFGCSGMALRSMLASELVYEVDIQEFTDCNVRYPSMNLSCKLFRLVTLLSRIQKWILRVLPCPNAPILRINDTLPNSMSRRKTISIFATDIIINNCPFLFPQISFPGFLHHTPAFIIGLP